MQDSFAHLPAEWQECIAAFLTNSEMKSGSTKTREVYHSVLSMFFRHHSDPNAVTRADVRVYLDQPSMGNRNRGKPISISRRNQRVTTLSAFYKYASVWDVADGQALYQKALPTSGFRVLQDVRRARAMSEDEIRRFFEAIPQDGSIRSARNRALFSFYLLSARRRSELQRLRFKDLKTSTVTDGANRKQSRTYKFIGKGRSRIDDQAELPPIVWDLLEEYWRLDGRLGNMAPDDPLFASVYAGKRGNGDTRKKPISGGWINREFQRIARAAGLSEARSVHSLRHSSAAIRYTQGEDVFSICRDLRHSSLDMTMRYLESLVSPVDTGAALIAARLPFLSAQR